MQHIKKQPRWFIRLALLLASAVLFALAFAPIGQFYLAWIGLIPFILAVHDTQSAWRALGWGWIGGFLFFGLNMYWIVYVTIPGLIALASYLALFWGFAAIVIRALLARQTFTLSALLVATTWVGMEWFRGNVSFIGRVGLPWIYIGQTQSPFLMMCQIADITGICGVTWWVALINATVALTILHRKQIHEVVPAMIATGVVLISIGAYGAFRLEQASSVDSSGPNVLVVQSNYPQSNSGEKGAPFEDIVDLHLRLTRDALSNARARGQKIDLVVWSETMMPAINPEARDVARGTKTGVFWDSVVQRIESLVKEYDTSLLVGGIRWTDWRRRGDDLVPQDRRNAAYFFPSSTGALANTRYDKIHLVPFGEYIPFKDSIPPLYQLFVKLGPNYYEEYILTPGSELTVFELPSGGRFVTAICFEDVVPQLVAAMLHGPDGSKRAQFIVNITNDGWFRGSQMAQHLQSAIFRSIENRVPTARSVNTGISGFIDSAGKTSLLVPTGIEGTSIATLQFDPRVTIYTRVGDIFALACAGATLGVVAWIIAQRLRNRSSGRQ